MTTYFEDALDQEEIAAAYMDAASALLAAELINEASLHAAAAVISDTGLWMSRMNNHN